MEPLTAGGPMTASSSRRVPLDPNEPNWRERWTIPVTFLVLIGLSILAFQHRDAASFKTQADIEQSLVAALRDDGNVASATAPTVAPTPDGPQPSDTSVSSLDGIDCLSPTTRALIKQAFADHLVLLGVGDQPQLQTLLDQLVPATSRFSQALLRVAQQQLKAVGKPIVMCEIAPPELQVPLFITFLTRNSQTGKMQGVSFDDGIAGDVLTFGDLTE